MSNPEKGGYGENLPKDVDTGEGSVREDQHEKGAGEILEETRRQAAAETKMGGMGREETPQEETTEGMWMQDSQEGRPERIEKVPKNETEGDEVPS